MALGDFFGQLGQGFQAGFPMLLEARRMQMARQQWQQQQEQDAMQRQLLQMQIAEAQRQAAAREARQANNPFVPPPMPPVPAAPPVTGAITRAGDMGQTGMAPFVPPMAPPTAISPQDQMLRGMMMNFAEQWKETGNVPAAELNAYRQYLKDQGQDAAEKALSDYLSQYATQEEQYGKDLATTRAESARRAALPGIPYLPGEAPEQQPMAFPTPPVPPSRARVMGLMGEAGLLSKVPNLAYEVLGIVPPGVQVANINAQSPVNLARAQELTQGRIPLDLAMSQYYNANSGALGALTRQRDFDISGKPGSESAYRQGQLALGEARINAMLYSAALDYNLGMSTAQIRAAASRTGTGAAALHALNALQATIPKPRYVAGQFGQPGQWVQPPIDPETQGQIEQLTDMVVQEAMGGANVGPGTMAPGMPMGPPMPDMRYPNLGALPQYPPGMGPNGPRFGPGSPTWPGGAPPPVVPPGSALAPQGPGAPVRPPAPQRMPAPKAGTPAGLRGKPLKEIDASIPAMAQWILANGPSNFVAQGRKLLLTPDEMKGALKAAGVVNIGGFVGTGKAAPKATPPKPATKPKAAPTIESALESELRKGGLVGYAPRALRVKEQFPKATDAEIRAAYDRIMVRRRKAAAAAKEAADKAAMQRTASLGSAYGFH